jgi:hypothetical protein
VVTAAVRVAAVRVATVPAQVVRVPVAQVVPVEDSREIEAAIRLAPMAVSLGAVAVMDRAERAVDLEANVRRNGSSIMPCVSTPTATANWIGLSC